MPNLVSVVLPTYNRSSFLRQTLTSILAQTYTPMEVIVVDDGSTDTSRDVVQEAARSARTGHTLRYHYQQKSGAPAARNAGAKLAHGQYIIFTDDDDLWTTGLVEARVSALSRSESGPAWAYGHCVVFRSDGGTLTIAGIMPSQVPHDARSPLAAFFCGWWNPVLQGALLRRDLVAAVGPWDERLLKGQDFDYKVRLLLSGAPFVHCETGITYYRTHPSSISAILSRAKARSHLRCLRRIERLLDQHVHVSDIYASFVQHLKSTALEFLSAGHLREGLIADRRSRRISRKHSGSMARFGALPLFLAYGALRARTYLSGVWHLFRREKDRCFPSVALETDTLPPCLRRGHWS